MFKRARDLLNEFYEDGQVDYNIKLQLEEWVGRFRIYNGGDDSKDLEEDIPKEVKKPHRKKLELYQGEVKEFANFLVRKFI